MNNNETATGSSATGNSTFLQQQKSIREREEEKRRLQAEMRRREQELLAKIKEQQRELESMKHEKGKVRSGIRIKSFLIIYKRAIFEIMIFLSFNYTQKNF